MGALLRIRGQKVFLRRGFWRCADQGLEVELTLTTAQWIRETGGPPLGVSDPEFEVAREIARRYRGKLLSHIPPRGKQAGREFFKMRQLRLFPD